MTAEEKRKRLRLIKRRAKLLERLRAMGDEFGDAASDPTVPEPGGWGDLFDA